MIASYKTPVMLSEWYGTMEIQQKDRRCILPVLKNDPKFRDFQKERQLKETCALIVALLNGEKYVDASSGSPEVKLVADIGKEEVVVPDDMVKRPVGRPRKNDN